MPNLISMTRTADRRSVTEAQQALTAAGHPTHASGHFDRATYRSVCAFQQARSLPVTGAVDDATWTALAGGPAAVATDEPTPAPVVEEAEDVLPADAPAPRPRKAPAKKARPRRRS